MELAERIQSAVSRVVPNEIAGAGWGVYHRGQELFGACGYTYFGSQDPVTVKTWFDLASLTKVIGLLPVMLSGMEEGRLTLDDRIGRCLTGLNPLLASVTLRQLLTHSSGLSGDFSSFLSAGLDPDARDQLWELIRGAIPAPFQAGETSRYSDLGYFLAGRYAECVYQEALGDLIHQTVDQGLGVALKERVDPLQESVAATRYCPVRGRMVHGEPQNMATWIWGSVCGHAGLFGSVTGVVRYGVEWLKGIPKWSPQLQRFAVQPIVAGRGLGWMLKGCPQLPELSSWPDDVFGHTGFTGTSLVIAPSWDLVAVLLTNRTHPNMDNAAIGPLRKEFHQIILDHCNSTTIQEL